MITPALILTAALLDGTYQMDLKIGEHLFNDVLVLKGAEKPISLRKFDGAIAGSITVPGSFTADLTGQAKCSRKTKKCELNFVIVAHEQGQDFKVFYKAESVPGTNPIVLTGTATLEDGKELGPFVATKK